MVRAVSVSGRRKRQFVKIHNVFWLLCFIDLCVSDEKLEHRALLSSLPEEAAAVKDLTAEESVSAPIYVTIIQKHKEDYFHPFDLPYSPPGSHLPIRHFKAKYHSEHYHDPNYYHSQLDHHQHHDQYRHRDHKLEHAVDYHSYDYPSPYSSHHAQKAKYEEYKYKPPYYTPPVYDPPKVEHHEDDYEKTVKKDYYIPKHSEYVKHVHKGKDVYEYKDPIYYKEPEPTYHKKSVPVYDKDTYFYDKPISLHYDAPKTVFVKSHPLHHSDGIPFIYNHKPKQYEENHNKNEYSLSIHDHDIDIHKPVYVAQNEHHPPKQYLQHHDYFPPPPEIIIEKHKHLYDVESSIAEVRQAYKKGSNTFDLQFIKVPPVQIIADHLYEDDPPHGFLTPKHEPLLTKPIEFNGPPMPRRGELPLSHSVSNFRDKADNHIIPPTDPMLLVSIPPSILARAHLKRQSKTDNSMRHLFDYDFDDIFDFEDFVDKKFKAFLGTSYNPPATYPKTDNAHLFSVKTQEEAKTKNMRNSTERRKIAAPKVLSDLVPPNIGFLDTTLPSKPILTIDSKQNAIHLKGPRKTTVLTKDMNENNGLEKLISSGNSTTNASKFAKLKSAETLQMTKQPFHEVISELTNLNSSNILEVTKDKSTHMYDSAITTMRNPMSLTSDGQNMTFINIDEVHTLARTPKKSSSTCNGNFRPIFKSSQKSYPLNAQTSHYGSRMPTSSPIKMGYK